MIEHVFKLGRFAENQIDDWHACRDWRYVGMPSTNPFGVQGGFVRAMEDASVLHICSFLHVMQVD